MLLGSFQRVKFRAFYSVLQTMLQGGYKPITELDKYPVALHYKQGAPALDASTVAEKETSLCVHDNGCGIVRIWKGALQRL